MNLVDSSAWLEYFVDGPNAKLFSDPLVHDIVEKLPIMLIFWA